MNWLRGLLRRHRLERAIERHLATEYGVYLYWTTGPYADGTKYQCATAFRPTSSDPVGQIVGDGVGQTRTKAMLALHHRLKGRPDPFQRLWGQIMGIVMSKADFDEVAYQSRAWR